MELWTQYSLGAGGAIAAIKYGVDLVLRIVSLRNGGGRVEPKEISKLPEMRTRCIDDAYFKGVLDALKEQAIIQTQLLKDNKQLLEAIRDNGRYKSGG